MGESGDLPSLRRLEGQLKRAVLGYRGRRRRRFLTALVAVGVVTPIGIATADELIFPDDPVVIGRGDVVTVGFTDPVTGIPVRCPDGELLQRRISGIDVVPAKEGQPPAVCSDGTVPEVYRRSEELWREFIENAPVGTDLSTAPGLRSFIIEADRSTR